MCLSCHCYLPIAIVFCTEKSYFYSSTLGRCPLVLQSFPVGIPKLSTEAALEFVSVFVNYNMIVISECSTLLFMYLDEFKTDFVFAIVYL